MSADRFRLFLRDLADPDKFVREPGVSVFDEHTERYWVDGTGRPVPAGHPDAERELVRVFDRAALQKIADVNNACARNGDLTPLVYGHTDPRRPEGAQPRPRGYAVNYRVEYDRGRGKWMLKADYYVKKSEHARAQTYPYTSIELWPRQGRIHPVSLLRRTPARDLGQWAYALGGPVLRYSMESTMARRYEMPPEDDELFSDLPEEAADAPADADPDAMSDEEVEQYNRHCYSHPLSEKYGRHMRKKYGMAEPPADPGAGLPEPTDLPSPDDVPPEEPLQNGAFAGPSNGMPAKHARLKSDADRIRYSRMEAQVEELKKEAARARGEKYVAQLLAEGYDLDEGYEAEQFSRRSPEQCERYAQHVRKHYRRAPVGGASVHLAPEPGRPAGEPDDFDDIVQYSREHPGVSWEECCRAVRKK